MAAAGSKTGVQANLLASEVIGFESLALEVAYYFPLVSLTGATSTTLELALPRNSLVDSFKVQVQARRVDLVQAQQVAQVRSYSQTVGTTTHHELVIDFGTPRTVSSVSLPSPLTVRRVYGWLGSQFNPSSAASVSDVDARSSITFPELRTERLRVLLSATPSPAQLDQVLLHLPEPPSGLAIAIDGAPPVWTHPDPVQPRPDVSQPDEAGWDQDSRRIVDLSAALAALTGDPLADDGSTTFVLKLTTAVPCTLNLQQQALATRRIRRVRFAEQTTTTLDFPAEGRLDLPLALPAPTDVTPRVISQVHWVAEADLGPQRTVPPLGPDAAPGEAGLPLAQAVVTPEVALITQLPPGSGIQTLQALRWPLQALGDGAEARVVLWEAGPPDTGSLPVQPLANATSEPVTLAPSDTEAWVSFPFKKPPLLPTTTASTTAPPMPWAALVVSRGQVAFGLAKAGSGAGALVDAMRLRRGPPNGPWKALPAPLQNASQVLDARARLRLAGLAPKDAPLAPLTLGLVDSNASQELNPVPRGERASLALGAGLGASQPVLRLTSRVAGRLALRDVDVVSNH
ncbi:hypothetical protein [Sphaerotilus microaerophilus]|uniref:DUF4139 domain-containing protein n=1 Tax=Sphaerotilus microaerophilus TaxID=2914710 RepID=A0ABM7YK83_9BURK|nr:hypothetical protein [Sphaerotilus sp. FB-5]BDI04715.1 hypothetical protein CATMQ487_16850 [Sphaerotilus sp. FB-5]